MINLGFISFAHMHAHSYAAAALQLENVNLVSVYDDNTKRGQAAAEKYGMTFQEDLNDFLQSDIDAVIICNENIHHKEMVLAAASSKKHILCEKPIATTVADAKEMIQACEENDVQLHIAFPVRFTASIQALKTIVDNGELGDILAARSTNRGKNPGDWFIDESLAGGGSVMDHTVHMVDIMRWIFQSEVSSVYSHIDSFFHDIPVDDAGILTLQFDNGVIASHDASWSRYEEYPNWGDVRLELIGTKGTASINNTKDNIWLIRPDQRTLSFQGFGNNTNLELIKNFIDSIEANQQPFITGMDGLKAMEVALAAYESNKERKTVELNHPNPK